MPTLPTAFLAQDCRGSKQVRTIRTLRTFPREPIPRLLCVTSAYTVEKPECIIAYSTPIDGPRVPQSTVAHEADTGKGRSNA
jgi:hypothetical protein